MFQQPSKTPWARGVASGSKRTGRIKKLCVSQGSTERPMSGQTGEVLVRKRDFLDPQVGRAPLIRTNLGVKNGRRPSGMVGSGTEPDWMELWV
jgi:hypothetical protein